MAKGASKSTSPVPWLLDGYVSGTNERRQLQLIVLEV
jgi:hypothetical protein